MSITSEHTDAIYDALAVMELASDMLMGNDFDGVTAGNMGWLLGSAKKRLAEALNAVEEVQFDQEATNE
ncbi:hypothetical protein [Ochrobactrum sp. CGA5]|uniref:hypothetical protein n=1 Tax=Ochrobactrum sp. CGA5 TaxID=2583453 RepID=UPI00111CFD1B|nr:hypothetical protein [Ochrobactrum sp. CGA5]